MNKLSKIILLFIILVSGGLKLYSQSDSAYMVEQEPKQQVRECEALNNKHQVAGAKQKLGTFYLNCDSVQKADINFREALKILESINDTLELFETNLNIGIHFEEKLHFSIALRYYLQANKYSANLNAKEKIRVIKKIGRLYYDLENYSKAFNYFVVCENIARENNLQYELALAYSNIGEVYRFDGKYKDAFTLYMASLEIMEKLDNQLGIAILYNNLALVFLKQKKYNIALEYFLKSQKIVGEVGDVEKIASIHTNIGHYYFEIQDYKTAIKSYLRTLNYKLLVQFREDIIYRDAYEGLYTAYKATGDFKNALKFYQLHYLLKEKISGINTQNQLMAIETRFAVEKEIQKTLFFAEIAEIEKLKTKRQATIFIIFLGLLLSIVILLGLIFRLKYKTFKQKSELYEKEKRLSQLVFEKTEAKNLHLASVNSELETSKIISQLQSNHFKMELAHKKRELASLVLHLSSKNEILTQIKENLIKRKFLRENEQVVSTILTEINSNLNLDRDWNSFKLHFEEIHPDFFKQLKEKYPNITNEELKLCAYLRINLSSKEIAQLLNITSIAVNKRRNRLRKKINVGQTENLYDFFSKIL